MAGLISGISNKYIPVAGLIGWTSDKFMPVAGLISGPSDKFIPVAKAPDTFIPASVLSRCYDEELL